jgi:hypothetical protein
MKLFCDGADDRLISRYQLKSKRKDEYVKLEWPQQAVNL